MPRRSRTFKPRRWKSKSRKRNNMRNRRRKAVNKYRTIGLPKVYYTSLKYVQQVTLNPSIGGLAASHAFRTNSLFDPDHTSTGHQPRFFDQLAAIYERYHVVGAKMRVTFSNSDSISPQIVGITTTASSTSSGLENDFLEDKECVWTQVSPRDGGDSTKTLTRGWSAKQAFGPDYKDADYGGFVTSNPSNTEYFKVWVAASDNSDTGPVYCTVEIMYRCMFMNQETPNQS